MSKEAKEKWNNIYSKVEADQYTPSKVITENPHLLPKEGRALDLACGAGADAIYLAKYGLQVDAWDISDTIIDKLSAHAKKNKLSIEAQARDINQRPPENNYYHVISVSHFLERDLIPILIRSLKPGGLIYYQTFSKTVTPSYSGPRNLDFRLGENELLNLFAELQLIVYREEGLLGDIQQGFRNEVMYIGQAKKQEV